ncbi:hypothetical protein [Scytonema sp. PRP1]
MNKARRIQFSGYTNKAVISRLTEEVKKAIAFAASMGWQVT